jgi:hypothetical protein
MIPAVQFTRFHGKSAWQAIFLQAAFTVLLLAPIMTTAAERVHFNRDIRPILTEKCIYCHGPDANHRKADLQLDVREDAISLLAAYAGAWRVAPPGIVIAAGGELLMIHPLKDGNVEVVPQTAAALLQVPPGDVASPKAAKHTLQLKAGTTYLFEVTQ